MVHTRQLWRFVLISCKYIEDQMIKLQRVFQRDETLYTYSTVRLTSTMSNT